MFPRANPKNTRQLIHKVPYHNNLEVFEGSMSAHVYAAAL